MSFLKKLITRLKQALYSSKMYISNARESMQKLAHVLQMETLFVNNK